MSMVCNAKNKRLRFWQEHPYCRYCDRKLEFEESTLDHWIPLAMGGTNGLHNLRLSCLQCNSRKADMLPLEFLKMMRAELRRTGHQ